MKKLYSSLLNDGPVEFSVNPGSEGLVDPVANIYFDFSTLLSDETYQDYTDNQFIEHEIIYRLVDDVPFGLSVEITEQ